jgi:hypothetical protein
VSIEEIGRPQGVEYPIQMTVAATEGNRVWDVPLLERRAIALAFYSTDVSTLRHQHPDNPVLHQLSE